MSGYFLIRRSALEDVPLAQVMALVEGGYDKGYFDAWTIAEWVDEHPACRCRAGEAEIRRGNVVDMETIMSSRGYRKMTSALASSDA